MNRRLQILVGSIAGLIILVSLALQATFRVRETRSYAQPHEVKTYSGTNYVVQLTETAIGKTDTGYVVIVYLHLENPNAFELALQRNWFILVDHDKDYYLPSTSGTQTESIKLPSNGVIEKEMLSFAVPDDSFEGTIALQIGQHYMTLIKGEKPFTDKLRNGEFRSFRRRDW